MYDKNTDYVFYREIVYLCLLFLARHSGDVQHIRQMLCLFDLFFIHDLFYLISSKYRTIIFTFSVNNITKESKNKYICGILLYINYYMFIKVRLHFAYHCLWKNVNFDNVKTFYFYYRYHTMHYETMITKQLLRFQYLIHKAFR